MSSDTSPIVTSVFHNREALERGWQAAIDLGYTADDVNVMLARETHARLFGGPGEGSKLEEKAAQAAEQPLEGAEKIGGPQGGSLGTVAPALAAAGTLLAIPGGILAAGPVAIALTAAGAVGAAGGLIGALTNWGVPKPRLEVYEGAIRGGSVLLGVQTRSPEDAQRLADAWRRSGGEQVHA